MKTLFLGSKDSVQADFSEGVEHGGTGELC